MHHLLHTVQTRTLCTEHRIFALLRSLPERSLQFRTLTVGNVEHTLRFPNLTTTHPLHSLRENHLISRLPHQFTNLIHKRLLDRRLLRQTHRLVDAAGEINDFRGLLLTSYLFLLTSYFYTLDDHLCEVRGFGLTFLLRHRRSPKWQSHLVHTTTDVSHQRRAEGDMCHMRHIEHDAQTALDACHVIGGKLTDLVACRTFVHVHLTDQVGQLTRVDLHRARGRAQSVGGTGLVTIVLILPFQFRQPFRILASGGEVTDFTLHGNAHP